jgi:hypothetical protein
MKGKKEPNFLSQKMFQKSSAFRSGSFGVIIASSIEVV